MGFFHFVFQIQIDSKQQKSLPGIVEGLGSKGSTILEDTLEKKEA